MKQKIYSIYDRATSDHAMPFVAGSDEAAFRLVKGSFAPQSQLVLYPSDYAIVQLGNFDSETGIIESEYKVVEEMSGLIPVFLRSCCLDGTFERGVENETKENSSAQG